jgi:hypothetical protein
VTRVYLEAGSKRVFACAVDWPGWARSASTDGAAIEALLTYAPRYAAVAGPGFAPGEPSVVARLAGNATTDFGAPNARGQWDDDPLPPAEADRLTGVLEASWAALDRVAAAAPVELRKGPRGGGRDRDEVVGHVRESERADGRRIGLRLRRGTPWPEQRAAVAAALRAGAPEADWPARYVVRLLTGHVLDHVWEIEDRAAPAATDQG